jgi:hypothetical protein
MICACILFSFFLSFFFYYLKIICIVLQKWWICSLFQDRGNPGTTYVLRLPNLVPSVLKPSQVSAHGVCRLPQISIKRVQASSANYDIIILVHQKNVYRQPKHAKLTQRRWRCSLLWYKPLLYLLLAVLYNLSRGYIVGSKPLDSHLEHISLHVPLWSADLASKSPPMCLYATARGAGGCTRSRK